MRCPFDLQHALAMEALSVSPNTCKSQAVNNSIRTKEKSALQCTRRYRAIVLNPTALSAVRAEGLTPQGTNLGGFKSKCRGTLLVTSVCRCT